MFHMIVCVVCSLAVGLIVEAILYWRHEHAIVDFENMYITAGDLLIVLSAVGIFMSFIK